MNNLADGGGKASASDAHACPCASVRQSTPLSPSFAPAIAPPAVPSRGQSPTLEDLFQTSNLRMCGTDPVTRCTRATGTSALVKDPRARSAQVDGALLLAREHTRRHQFGSLLRDAGNEAPVSGWRATGRNHLEHIATIGQDKVRHTGVARTNQRRGVSHRVGARVHFVGHAVEVTIAGWTPNSAGKRLQGLNRARELAGGRSPLVRGENEGEVPNQRVIEDAVVRQER